MPKNKGRGGKKFRSGKKSTNNETVRKLETKDKDQEYAKVLRMLGNRRLIALTNEDKQILCHIPGKFKSRVWINSDDIILITLRDYQADKSDVIYKYTAQEVKKLVKMGELSKILSDGIEDREDEVIIYVENEKHTDSEEEIHSVVEYPNSDTDSDTDSDISIGIDDF